MLKISLYVQCKLCIQVQEKKKPFHCFAPYTISLAKSREGGLGYTIGDLIPCYTIHLYVKLELTSFYVIVHLCSHSA